MKADATRYVLEGRFEPSSPADEFFLIEDFLCTLAVAQSAAGEYMRKHLHGREAQLQWIEGARGCWYANHSAITLRIKR